MEINRQDSMQEQLEQLKKQVSKPNILICGATGSGKSSLINEIFGKETAKVSAGAPVTRGVTRYASEKSSVVLYDSEGYEIGKEKLTHFTENIIGCIDQLEKEHPNDPKQQMHAVWYCISLAAKRVTDLDLRLLSELSARRIPTAVVFTKLDMADEQDLAQMKAAVFEVLPQMACFASCSPSDPTVRAAVAPYVQHDELIAYTLERLPDALKEGLFRACTGALKEKRRYVAAKVIPVFISSACAAVVVPVPFSDSAILAPIQLAMVTKIVSIYGIDRIAGVVGSVLETTVVSQIGKMLSASILGNLAKLIPGIGTGVGTAVNAGIATVITTVLGYAMSEICYRYCTELMQKGEADPHRYFNEETMRQMILIFLERYRQSKKEKGK